MALKQNNFNNGTNGATVTGASTAGGGDQLTISAGTGGTITFDNSHPAHGVMGIQLSAGAAASCIVFYTGYSATSLAMRRYCYFTALPTGTTPLMAILDTGSASVGTLFLDTAGKFVTQSITGSLHTSATAVTVGTQYRLELSGAEATTSTGTLNFSAYVGDSLTTFDTFSTTTTNMGTTAFGSARFGRTQGITSTFIDWCDDVAANDGTTTFIGPAASTTPASFFPFF